MISIEKVSALGRSLFSSDREYLDWLWQENEELGDKRPVSHLIEDKHKLLRLRSLLLEMRQQKELV